MNRFDELNASADSSWQRETEDLQFEDRRVDYLMRQFGLQRQALQMRRQRKDQGNVGSLTFDLFEGRFPDFPFRFFAHRLVGVPLATSETAMIDDQGRPQDEYDEEGVRRTPYNYQIHRDALSAEPARFKNFTRVPFVVAYLQRLEELGDDIRPTGMVFPRKGFAQGMVIHNDEDERYWSEGLCQVYKGQVLGENTRLYVQPFRHLIAELRDGDAAWRPAAD